VDIRPYEKHLNLQDYCLFPNSYDKSIHAIALSKYAGATLDVNRTLTQLPHIALRKQIFTSLFHL